MDCGSGSLGQCSPPEAMHALNKSDDSVHENSDAVRDSSGSSHNGSHSVHAISDSAQDSTGPAYYSSD